MLVLDKRDHDVVRRALGRYQIYLQACVDLIEGNEFIWSEQARVSAILKELETNND